MVPFFPKEERICAQQLVLDATLIQQNVLVQHQIDVELDQKKFVTNRFVRRCKFLLTKNLEGPNQKRK